MRTSIIPGLAELKGIGPALAGQLSKHDISSVDQVADAAVGQLTAVPGIGQARARMLIVAAQALRPAAPAACAKAAEAGAGKPGKAKKKKGKKSQAGRQEKEGKNLKGQRRKVQDVWKKETRQESQKGQEG